MFNTITIKRALFFIIVVGTAIAFLLSSHLSLAQQGGASGLQIAPTRTELTLKPGTGDNITLALKNVTAGTVLAKPEVDDFVSDNNTGTPRLITDPNQHSPFSIKDFVSNLPSITLKSNESKTIKIPVNIPSKQPPGGYFGVIRYIAEPVDKNTTQGSKQISLTASLGHIVLVDVPGALKEQLQLISFSAEKGGKTGSIFAASPDSMALGLKNSGNSFSKPFGTVTIKNFRGKEVFKYEINNTDPRGNILPDSTRIFHDKIKDLGSAPGRYTAIASVSYGAGGDVLVNEIHFWIIPIWLRILAGLIILAILVTIYLIYRRLRGHERRYNPHR